MEGLVGNLGKGLPPLGVSVRSRRPDALWIAGGAHPKTDQSYV
ncbi:MAG: hypothetical protein ACYCTZ_06910 [Candidatus Dormibacteria bacterium]